MKLPQSPALGWASLVLLGYLSGDLAAALLERNFSVPIRRPSQASQAAPATLNGIKVPGDLTFLLTNRSAESAVNDTLNDPAVVPGQPGLPPGGVTAGNATGLPTLSGTLEGQGQSLAVLQMGSETQVVAVGEEWLGFRVLEVTSFQARLADARGSEHILTMKIAESQDSPAGVPPAFPGAQNPYNVTVPSPGNNTANASPVMTSRELRALMDDTGWVRNVLVQPVLRGGESVGIQINYLNANTPFPRLGILNGDIIKSLNNKPLKGVESLSEGLMELRNATSLNFQIERGGQTLNHTVELQP